MSRILVLIPILLHQGCDLDQMADSLILDSANLALEHHWTDKQRDKYFEIAKLGNDECIALVQKAGLRFIQDPTRRLAVQEPSSPYAAVFGLMDPNLPQRSLEDQLLSAKNIARSICFSLHKYLVTDNEMIDYAAKEAAIESINDELKGYLTETQRQKYKILFEMGREECVKEIASVYVRMVTDSELQSNLNQHGKSTMMIAASQYNPAARAGIAMSAAGLICDQLARSFMNPEEGRLT